MLEKMAPISQDQILPLPGDTGALANRINAATRSAHTKINNLINLKIVFALRDYKIYRQGIQSFYHVFKTFEECWKIEMEKDTEVAAILREVWTPAITRTDPLTLDMLFYYDNDRSKFEIPVMPEQIEFVKYIRKTTADKPHLLLAYGHVMYLALFAGGRILRSNIMKSTGLFPQKDGLSTEEVAAQGTNLFRFQVDDEEALRVSFKTRYELATRNALTEAQKRDIIDEALVLFQKNTDCISEIAAKNQKALMKKMGYKVMKGAYIGFLALIFFLVFYLVRRIVF
ncbi:heme-binding protein Hmx1p [Trichomonascus vanleenenianus]|uniref:Hmx1p n=1 Tax=Trichomonascus vanleenenianus TaxID=2268995 RepID=UPI003ECB5E93